VISVKFTAQIGNQLFQYCVGKILAERTGLAYLPPSAFLDKAGRPVKWSAAPLWTMTPTAGRELAGPPRKYHFNQQLTWMDWDSFDATKPIAITHGYFQRLENFAGYLDKIREWLRIDPAWFVATDPDAVYVHCRRTDYVDVGLGRPPNRQVQGVATTLDEYRECLREFPDAKRLVVVTDDVRDKFLLQFGRLLPYTVSGLAWDLDWLLLASARNLLICQSTYSWWAGFLGRAERIVCPVFPGTFWHDGMTNPENPNLLIQDERWRWCVRQG
jgi:hypothetical protein